MVYIKLYKNNPESRSLFGPRENFKVMNVTKPVQQIGVCNPSSDNSGPCYPDYRCKQQCNSKTCANNNEDEESCNDATCGRDCSNPPKLCKCKWEELVCPQCNDNETCIIDSTAGKNTAQCTSYNGSCVDSDDAETICADSSSPPDYTKCDPWKPDKFCKTKKDSYDCSKKN